MARSDRRGLRRLLRFVQRTTRYAIVGALGAVISNVIVIAGDMRGISYLPAMVAAFIIAVPTCYVLHSRFTFREPASGIGLVRFAGGAAAGFPLSIAVIALLSSRLQVPMIIASPAATLTAFAGNYCLAYWSIALCGSTRPGFRRSKLS